MRKIAGIDEQVIIERIKQGDQTAFELLFKYYYPGLLVFASQITLNKDEAVDIVQEFFVNFWVKRKLLKTKHSIKSYIFTSIKNRSLNFLKKRINDARILEQMAYLTENNELYNPGLFIESELHKKIENTIKKLPDRCREVFVLSRIDGLTNDVIAEKLQISKRTVETHISNALKILRIELKNYLGILLILGVIN